MSKKMSTGAAAPQGTGVGAMIPVAPVPGSNSAAAFESFLDEMRELGKLKGVGGNSQIKAAVSCVEKSSEGVVDVSKTEKVYDAFLDAEIKTGTLTGTATEPKKDRDQRVSELRQLVKMGAIKTIDPVKQIHAAVTLVGKAKLDGRIAKGKKVYECLVGIARAQCKIPEHELGEDEMLNACRPKVGRDKNLADELGALRNKADKLLKEHGDLDQTHDHIAGAIASLQAAIDDQGGTSADHRAAEKARKELEKLQS